MKTFVQGLSICKDVNCEEITKVDFSSNNISLEGIEVLGEHTKRDIATH